MIKKTSAKKRKSTKMDTIEEKYGSDYGEQSNTKLENYLKKIGYPSLSRLLRNG